MIRRLVVTVCLLLVGAYTDTFFSRADTIGTFDVKTRMQENAKSQGFPVRTGRFTEVSPNRIEFYSENDDMVFAVIAFRSKGENGTDSMGILCNATLSRKYQSSYEKEISFPADQDNKISRTAVVNLALGETLLKGVTKIRGASYGDWRFYSCKTRAQDIIPVDIEARLPHYIAQIFYGYGKKALSLTSGKDEALTYFQNTRNDPSVYQNALSYMIPLLNEIKPEFSERLYRDFFKVDQVGDPDALIYLGEFKLRQQNADQADEIFNRCLLLDPENDKCHAYLQKDVVGSEKMKRKGYIDFDDFFNGDE